MVKSMSLGMVVQDNEGDFSMIAGRKGKVINLQCPSYKLMPLPPFTLQFAFNAGTLKLSLGMVVRDNKGDCLMFSCTLPLLKLL